MATASTSELLLDIYHENQKAPRTTPFQNFALGVTAGAGLIAAWQYGPWAAGTVLVAGVAVAVSTLSKGTRAKVRLWCHDRRERRLARRYRDELRGLVQALRRLTGLGSDTLPGALEEIDKDFLRDMPPWAICSQLAHLDLALESHRNRDLAMLARGLEQNVEAANTFFVHRAVEHLRERAATKPLAAHERERINRALENWCRFLERFEAFQQKLNPEPGLTINHFRRPNRLWPALGDPKP